MKPNSCLEYYKKFYTFGQYGLLSWRQYYGAGSGLSNVQPIRKHNKKMNPALCCSVYKKYFDEFYREYFDEFYR